MQHYDYIICGAGASGLLVAHAMANDSFFDQKQILIIDEKPKNKNDRTWCFWEQESGDWDMIVHTRWKSIHFKSDVYSKNTTVKPYQYKQIRSLDFYTEIINFLHVKSNVNLIEGVVFSYKNHKNYIQVQTKNETYTAQKVLTSIPIKNPHLKQHKYPVLQQHFIGWYITTDTAVFDSTKATFMDFDIPQNGNTRFMYVLPSSPNHALIEYTLFSKTLLPEEEYEDAIKTYLEDIGVTSYQIVEKEKGCIPMTCYPFHQHNSKNILHIGTAGGWTKASTGYTFKNAMKKTTQLIAFLKEGQEDFTTFHKKNRFWYYDLILLDVLAKYNEKGAALFTQLFRKNKTATCLQFLDEETTWVQELQILWTMPSWLFLKTILLRIFSRK